MIKIRSASVFALVFCLAVSFACEASAQGPVRRALGVVFGGRQVAHQGRVVNYSREVATPNYARSVSYSSSQGYSNAEVGIGSAAWQHCRREAELQARRGRQGHILGVAPGARMQGVGHSFSPSNPYHCVGVGLIARAGVLGRDGRWYWSAAYLR